MREFPESAHINLQKEAFSYAYIKQISAAIGYECNVKDRAKDNVGIDLSIEVPGELERCLSPQVEAQVKCTSQNCIKNSVLTYSDLSPANYARLIYPSPYVRQLLIVVVVPADPNDWIKVLRQSAVETKTMAAAFWISLEGKPKKTNKSSVSVKIPVANRLTPEVLREILRKVAKQEDL
ncbi:MAG: DUF4365 domain-containing protein [Cyanobacteria bacterium J06560_6]